MHMDDCFIATEVLHSLRSTGLLNHTIAQTSNTMRQFHRTHITIIIRMSSLVKCVKLLNICTNSRKN